MGYTQEGKKMVIWTVKRWEADKWPFHDDVTNYTDFYENLKSKLPFFTCLASHPEHVKIQLASNALGIPGGNIVLRSKKSHYKKKNKNDV